MLGLFLMLGVEGATPSTMFEIQLLVSFFRNHNTLVQLTNQSTLHFLYTDRLGREVLQHCKQCNVLFLFLFISAKFELKKKMTNHFFFLFNDVECDVPLWARQEFYKGTKLNHSAFHCLVVNNIRLRHVATPPFPMHPVRQRQGAKQTRLPLSTPTACFPTPPGQKLLF